MREEYIRLIKEYIKLKPEYKQTFEEVKANVLSVGATEEELDEAIKQITGLPSSSLVMNHEEALPLENPYPRDKKIWKKIPNKKRLAIVFSAFAAIIFAFVFFPNSQKQTKIIVQNKINPVISKAEKAKIIPPVFANTNPIDVNKTFSFPKSDTSLTITSTPKKEILGFFPYWVLEKADEIDLRFLTSLSLFGLEIDGKGEIVTSNNNGQVDGGWNMWNDPKLDGLIRRAKNNGIKTYITLKAFNNENIETLSLSDEAQKTFISNAMYLVNSKNLDGINLDFEYIGEPEEKVKKAFVRLVTNLETELKRQFPNSVLTIDTYLSSGSTNTLFDITLLAQVSDQFVIMGYDMHTPLGPAGSISAMGGETNVIGYVQNYLEKIPAEKIILAVPYYGYDWPKNSSASILSYSEIANSSKKRNI
ncbi:MAG: glycosyl hydrolase family 18 protein, partial [Actinobacteria bacterium]|nr:glycosyl hydrolase family 18 protein [Actinomycetota bacterium]